MSMGVPIVFDSIKYLIKLILIQIPIAIFIQNIKKLNHIRYFVIQLKISTVIYKVLFFAFLIIINIKKPIRLNIVLKLHPAFLLQLFKQHFETSNRFLSHTHKLLFSVFLFWLHLFHQHHIVFLGRIINNFGQLIQIKFLRLNQFNIPIRFHWIFF